MVYRDSMRFGFGFGLTPWVKRLLIANTAVFVATALVPLLFGLFAFVPALVFYRPWTPFTYMFVHGDLLHLLVNMLALFFFGSPLESNWGSREFIKYYVICGLGGAVLSFLFAFQSAVVGASGAVFGVMLAFAMKWPNAPIYFFGIFPIPAKILVGILVLLDLYAGVTGVQNGIAQFAHLGGFAAGFIYLKFGDRTAMSLAALRRRVARRRMKVVEGGGGTPARPARRRADEEKMLDELDRILDKISKQGMGSLTAEEKRVLDEVSRSKRSN